MTYKALLIAFFVLFSTSLARQQHHQQQQQGNVCQLRQVEALEPYYSIQAEAGVSEIWDANNQQFQCAGVDFIRHRIQPGGLLLPSYLNTPILVFVERGRGIQGVVLPGCPETYEYAPEQQQQYTRERRQQSFQDRHQKVENLKQGDVLAVPAGAAHWIYNEGGDELVVVVFLDTQNKANQLDQNQRRFFLAGNPQAQSQQQQGGRSHTQEQRPGHGQKQPYKNIFSGFDTEILAEAFDVDRETAESLQGERDERGHIVNVGQNLKIIRPQQQQQYQQHPQQRPGQQPQQRPGQQQFPGQHQPQQRPGQQHQPQQQPGQQQFPGQHQPQQRPGQQQFPGQQQGGRGSGWSNGIEETICSLKLIENIDNPTQADFVNPQAGRLSNLNNLKFPILQYLELSAERGELYPNAIYTPQWTLNAHSLIYITHGSMRLQMVDNQGNSVFNNELQEGQVLVVPQNYAVIRRAGQQGCRWISFRTNDNAISANLAGRLSAIRSMPVDVVANSYQLSIDEAQRLKNSQDQAVLLSPSYSKSQGRASA